jgi:hypothetical protein
MRNEEYSGEEIKFSALSYPLWQEFLPRRTACNREPELFPLLNALEKLIRNLVNA